VGGPTLKTIADKVGLTESALLYHFGSREELFWAIIQARDEAESAQARDETATVDFSHLGEIVADNASTPGLVKLFLDQAVAGISPSHPAHDYMRQRYGDFARGLAEGLQRDRGLAEERAAWLARILLAAADGLQIQWLLDDQVNMRRDLAQLYVRVSSRGRSRGE
jgi:AcrR family transcriptional regulator